MNHFDWHSDVIADSTPIDSNYKNTQNVRRFLIAACGKHFEFDRAFMAWIKDGKPKTMGDVAAQWLQRNKASPNITDNR